MYHVDYTVYDHEGRDEHNNPLFHRAGSELSPDPVARMAEAEPYLHGTVKWDGCSHWHFDEQDRIMLHGCSKEDITRLGDILGECWEWTRKLCPEFEK